MRLILTVFALLMFMSCTNPQPKHAAVPDKVAMADDSQLKLAEGMLVSTNDTVCGMLIGNEPSDTLTFDGKLFGFCSSGCKETFMSENKIQ